MNTLRILLLGTLALLAVSPARTEQIVSAVFSSGSDPIPLAALNEFQPGQSPDGANLPGGLWQLAGGGAYDGRMSDNAARMHNGGAVAITLGDYTEKALVTVSAEITFESLPVEDESPKTAAMKQSMAKGMALLGFYSALEKTAHRNPLRNFTGLRLGFDGGLQLLVNGRPEGEVIPGDSAFDPHEPAVLTYTANTLTGKITAVQFAGKSLTAPETTAFTPAATAFAGFGGSLGNHPIDVEFRNFEVSARRAP